MLLFFNKHGFEMKSGRFPEMTIKIHLLFSTGSQMKLLVMSLQFKVIAQYAA